MTDCDKRPIRTTEKEEALVEMADTRVSAADRPAEEDGQPERPEQTTGMSEDEIRARVREDYGRVAQQERSCCGPGSTCSPGGACSPGGTQVDQVAKQIGYTDEELATAPEGANLGLGCGNPTALATLKEGETVLDLGSGAGFDCFLAADRVGRTGRVIGVDMTPDMLDKAKQNAAKGGYDNVEFRLGEIEHLPVADGAVDVVISNCVINLSPDKAAVFGESHRALRPGGRMMVSDVVLLDDLPAGIKDSAAAYVGCISGAMAKDEYLQTIKDAGFDEVCVVSETHFPIDFLADDPTVQSAMKELGMGVDELAELAGSAVSVAVEAKKAG